ncbi:MAG: hypothetical protein Unbinned5081contig1000_6 [Prokaryotic dsDNA virus sp.]|nr:MAG: hypothetical protein Unbinned5081contig1000_6 [Prokaryotic dsDNA virus sp.]
MYRRYMAKGHAHRSPKDYSRQWDLTDLEELESVNRRQDQVRSTTLSASRKQRQEKNSGPVS